MSPGDTNTKSKGRSQVNPAQSEALNASQLSLDDLLSAPSRPSAPLGLFSRRLDRWHNKSVVTELRGALQALHDRVAIIPPLQSATETLISCVDLLPTTTSREEFKQIAAELQMLSHSLITHLTTSAAEPSKCMTNLSLLIQQQATLIATKMGLNLNKGRRFEESKRYEEEVRGHYRQINSLFRQLMVDATMSTWSIVNEHLANSRLEGLRPAKLAYYDSTLSTELDRQMCTEGTRVDVLARLEDWVEQKTGVAFYWINGMAGTGKTTILSSFCQKLEEAKRLAASFFCSRASRECRQAHRIIPTIAYQLARYSRPFQQSLCEVLRDDPDIGSKNLRRQFQRLLEEPLMASIEAIPKNLVVVIDGLDECDAKTGMEPVLTLFVRYAGSLPLKFLVASRPEPEIYQILASEKLASRLYLHDIEKALVQADIMLYIKDRLKDLSPTTEQVEELASRSCNLFIYASTVVRQIRNGVRSVPPRRMLEYILDMISQPIRKHEEIDQLYAAILGLSLPSNEDDASAENAKSIRAVLDIVLCAQEAIDLNTIAALTGLGDVEQVEYALRPLLSVLHYSEETGLVSTLHASFPQFMFNKNRSGDFFCDLTEANYRISLNCFQVMKLHLRFNICDLESSYRADEDVDGLDRRLESSISSPLLYVSQYWAHHLQQSPGTDQLRAMFEDFLSTRFLFWMEVMNLKGIIGTGQSMLLKAREWLRSYESSSISYLQNFVDDARDFVTAYAASKASHSTPHIYISMFLFCKRSSAIHQHYSPRIYKPIQVTSDALAMRETAALATWRLDSPVLTVKLSSDGSQVAFGCLGGIVGTLDIYNRASLTKLEGHTSDVNSITFSPNDIYLASGSDDYTVRLWNAFEGKQIGEPLKHTNIVNSVAFSPDGAHLTSGSNDHVVRVWELHPNEPALANQLEGHTSEVWAVAYSPSGNHIASGSKDCTIRIWKANDGTLVHQLEGHTQPVWSIAFSPDGAYIASGSYDPTIQLWDTISGALIDTSFQGHTGSVSSISFSSDGQRIVTGSYDNTIRIWNPFTGQLISGPLKGHTSEVLAVAFSSDDTRIVSGSYDSTIQVWNTSDIRTSARLDAAYDPNNSLQGLSEPTVISQVKMALPEGHSRSIYSVTFSPDGKHIASGSCDKSVCVWNALDGRLVAGPFQGHTDDIWSVTFSPDGQQIISGSSDRTLHIWDVSSGKSAFGPLIGHSSIVCSVATSPSGLTIASGSKDMTIRTWNLKTGKSVTQPLTGHTKAVSSVVFTPDDQLLVSGSFDRTIRLWNPQSGSLVAGPFQEHTDGITSVSVSPNGAYIASGSLDGKVQIWHVDGRPFFIPGQCPSHNGYVTCVAFSPDSTHVVSGSADRTLQVWNVQNGTLADGPFYGHTESVESVAFSSDGTRIISGSQDQIIRLWQHSYIPVSDQTWDTPGTTKVLPKNHSFGHWKITTDGWVMTKDERLLFWMPPEMLGSLLTPGCQKAMNCTSMIEVNLGDALIGEMWRECYKN